MAAERLFWVYRAALTAACQLGLVVFATATFAQDATVDAPSAVSPNAEISVRWSGPNAPGDFIAISEPDDRAETFTSYARTSAGNPSTLPTPEIGDYEIRYVGAAGLTILARRPLSVRVDAEAAKLVAPDVAAPGAPLSVTVPSVSDPADYITIVEAGAPNDAFGPYARLRDGPTVQIEAPSATGDYEIRQVQARDQAILARAPLEIAEPAPQPSPVEPTPDPAPPASVAAEPVAPSAAQAEPEPTEAQSPVTQDVPQKQEAAAKTAPAPPAEASLMALVAVDAAAEFHVAWSGPGAPGDLIGIAAAGASDLLTSAEAAGGVMVALIAPDAPGDYVLRYVAEGGGVLAERDLEVR